jgi:protein TonB
LNKVELPRNSLLQSIVLHLILVLGIGLLFNGDYDYYDEIPVEITEFIRKLGEPTTGAPKTEKKSILNPESKKNSGFSSVPTSATESSSQSGSPDGDPAVEDYEVSEMPLLLNEVRVPYPSEARSRGIQGNVVFELLISSDGRVRNMQVLGSPDPVLTEAARKAVSLFRFRPARMGDKTVAIRIRYTYRFLLQ